MIDFTTKEFGFELYLLKAKLNAFSRQKIYKKDKDGVEWFRYSEEHNDFSYEKYTYVGKQEVISYGEVDGIEDCVEYYLKNAKGDIQCYEPRNLHFFDVPEWYLTEEEVIDQIKKLQLIGKELDRK